MSDFSVRPPGFNGLNRVLGSSRKPASYLWNGNDVVLKSGKFDQNRYLDSKFFTIQSKQSVLGLEEKKATFIKVISDNRNLLLDMEAASPEQLQQLDTKFNLLVEAAISHCENEHSLRLSKENIKNSLMTTESWMDPQEVTKLMRLVRNTPAEAPDPRKFVPKYRR